VLHEVAAAGDVGGAVGCERNCGINVARMVQSEPYIAQSSCDTSRIAAAMLRWVPQ
jgi:hypothetical protein